jgi:hypothetical protein
VIDDAFRGANPSGRRGCLVHHHFPQGGNGRAGHLLQSRNGLPEGGSAGFPQRLLELGFRCQRSSMAKCIDSWYEPGQRSGAWQKMRVNQGQEFVIGGYTPSRRNFDAIIFGYYDDEGRLVYVARTRNGFTPASRDAVFKRFRAFWLASNSAHQRVGRFSAT